MVRIRANIVLLEQKVKSKIVIEILTRKIDRLLRVMTFQNSLLASHNEEGIACRTNQIHTVKFQNSD